MDKKYSAQVWNYVVAGYELEYFNVINMDYGPHVNDKKILASDYIDDQNSKFRSVDTFYIVGVQVIVSYMPGLSPFQYDIEPLASYAIEEMVLRYDLELNRDGEIVGGEWWSEEHPDFLWLPAVNAQARAPFDRYMVPNWRSSMSIIPLDMARFARKSSAVGRVSSIVLNELFKFSR